MATEWKNELAQAWLVGEVINEGVGDTFVHVWKQTHSCSTRLPHRHKHTRARAGQRGLPGVTEELRTLPPGYEQSTSTWGQTHLAGVWQSPRTHRP